MSPATPDPPPRVTPIAPPDLRNELRAVADLVLHDDDLVEDVDVAACELDDAPVDGVRIRRARLRGPAWTGATLRGLELRDVVVEGGELSGLTLDDANLERVAFVGCRMAGLVAPALRAVDVVFDDCRLDDAWLRAATLERTAFDGCSMPRADLYAARLTRSRLVRCDLTEIELSQAVLDDVALHGSRIPGLKGGAALRNAVIGSDQVYDVAGPVLHAANIRMDDDYLRAPEAAG